MEAFVVILIGSDILVLIAYAHKATIKAHADSWTRGLNFSHSVHLHAYFVYASSEGSCKSAHMDMLT